MDNTLNAGEMVEDRIQWELGPEFLPEQSELTNNIELLQRKIEDLSDENARLQLALLKSNKIKKMFEEEMDYFYKLLHEKIKKIKFIRRKIDKIEDEWISLSKDLGDLGNFFDFEEIGSQLRLLLEEEFDDEEDVEWII